MDSVVVCGQSPLRVRIDLSNEPDFHIILHRVSFGVVQAGSLIQFMSSGAHDLDWFLGQSLFSLAFDVHWLLVRVDNCVVFGINTFLGDTLSCVRIDGPSYESAG